MNLQKFYPPASFLPALFLGAVLCLTAMPSLARAQSAMQTFKIGAITLVALYDHPAEHKAALFNNVDPQTLSAILPSGAAASSVNAFLVQTGSSNVLIDTGLGANLGGEIVHSLALLGLTPKDINIILITHMHLDHIGGLTEDGKPVYPNALLKIGNLEQAFWLAPNAVDPKNNPYINFATAQAAAAVYPGRIQGFEFGEEVAPGVTALNAVGHTPGHTAFMIESAGRKLLVWGDLVHAVPLQLQNPDIYPAYDYDPVAATATRKAFLERVSAEHIPVAGMHIPFPGVGYIEKAGAGYTFTPMPD